MLPLSFYRFKHISFNINSVTKFDTQSWKICQAGATSADARTQATNGFCLVPSPTGRPPILSSFVSLKASRSNSSLLMLITWQPISECKNSSSWKVHWQDKQEQLHMPHLFSNISPLCRRKQMICYDMQKQRISSTRYYITKCKSQLWK